MLVTWRMTDMPHPFRMVMVGTCFNLNLSWHGSHTSTTTHRLVVGNSITDGLLLGEHWRGEQHTTDAVNHTIRGVNISILDSAALHTTAGAAVAALAGALAEASLPLGSLHTHMTAHTHETSCSRFDTKHNGTA